MQIHVNGEARTVPAGHNILDLLGLLGLDPERVAVELDLNIVKKARWRETVLHPGARLEIVQFVGGG